VYLRYFLSNGNMTWKLINMIMPVANLAYT